MALLGVKALIFIPGKSVYLSGLGVLFPNIQQGLLGTRHVSPPGWWSAWSYCLDQLFLERGHVSDSCSTVLTAAARPYQLLSIPGSYSRIRRGLPVVIVQRTCLALLLGLMSNWATRTSLRSGWRIDSLVDRFVNESEARQWWSSRDFCFLARSV